MVSKLLTNEIVLKLNMKIEEINAFYRSKFYTIQNTDCLHYFVLSYKTFAYVHMCTLVCNFDWSNYRMKHPIKYIVYQSKELCTCNY